jgi:hypothetical protein
MGYEDSDFSREDSLIIDVLSRHREVVHYIGYDLRITEHTHPNHFYNNHQGHRDFLHDLYDTDDRLSTVIAMQGHQDAERRGDIEIWSALHVQAGLAFDEEQFPDTVWYFNRRGIESMSRPALLAGAAFAAERIFSGLNYPELHSPEQALAGLQGAAWLDDNTMSGIIRMLAEPHLESPGTLQTTADSIFITAVRHPDGLTRKAVSNHQGDIDTYHFNGDEIIDRNLISTLLATIKQNERARENFVALRQAYPAQFEALANTDVYVRVLHQSIFSWIVNQPGKPFDPLVFTVMPPEDIVAIARMAQDNLRYYLLNKVLEPGTNGDVDLLKLMGFEAGGMPHHYTEDTIKGIDKLIEQLDSPKQPG